MIIECINDSDEMQIARESSWLCELFQINQMTIEDKQAIIRNLVTEFKLKKQKENHGQSY